LAADLVELQSKRTRPEWLRAMLRQMTKLE
jgi:hypothetical protein